MTAKDDLGVAVVQLTDNGAPTNETTVTHLTDIRGGMTTRQTLREWHVEHAPLREVNLQNLSDNTLVSTRVASCPNASFRQRRRAPA